MALIRDELISLTSIVVKTLPRFFKFRKALLGDEETGAINLTCAEFRKAVIKVKPIDDTLGDLERTCMGNLYFNNLTLPNHIVKVSIGERYVHTEFRVHGLSPGYENTQIVHTKVPTLCEMTAVRDTIATLAAKHWLAIANIIPIQNATFSELRDFFTKIKTSATPELDALYDAKWDLSEVDAELIATADTLQVKTLFGTSERQFREPEAAETTEVTKPETTETTKPETTETTKPAEATKPEVAEPAESTEAVEPEAVEDDSKLICDTTTTESCYEFAAELLKAATYEDILSYAPIATPEQVAKFFGSFAGSVRRALLDSGFGIVDCPSLIKRGGVIAVYEEWKAAGCKQNTIQNLIHNMSGSPTEDYERDVTMFIEDMDTTSLALFIMRLAKVNKDKITWLGGMDTFIMRLNVYNFDDDAARDIIFDL